MHRFVPCCTTLPISHTHITHSLTRTSRHDNPIYAPQLPFNLATPSRVIFLSSSSFFPLAPTACPLSLVLACMQQQRKRLLPHYSVFSSVSTASARNSLFPLCFLPLAVPPALLLQLVFSPSICYTLLFLLLLCLLHVRFLLCALVRRPWSSIPLSGKEAMCSGLEAMIPCPLPWPGGHACLSFAACLPQMCICMQ